MPTSGGVGMRRRNFMTVLAGAATYPLLAGAQQKPMPVIGYLSPVSSGPNTAPSVAAFRQGLAETGWVEGKMWRSNTAGLRANMIDCPHWPPISSTARST